ncbi:Sensor histidine kinase YpdA [Paraliobacillus sp. PM-2]|uniref:sensor histidine kinase n=1 Tax=Paraliobacillus sp. PM-2 TaxID=1462524 RepID=UPI00061BC1A9|nr:sensor histidine kinase [Paraliobacillus sp. PM-2]CQR45945.1 Sensor histidine kinase YpdA [Paraliobacillus sp. PM-2]
MKSIRSKLILYFFVFILLFNLVSLSIYFSSNKLMNDYHASFDHFFILNSISQTSTQLYEASKNYVMSPESKYLDDYYDTLAQLKEERLQIEQNTPNEMRIQVKNYLNLINAFIYQTELTIGFVLRDDIERYTAHLKEAQRSVSYIQNTTLELIDIELSGYQLIYDDLQERNNDFRLFILYLSLTTIMLAIFIAIRFSKGISHPIQELSQAAKQISVGDFSGEKIVFQSNDELKLLADSFNHMRSSIENLIEEIKEKSEQERLMKELELKHLQNQINPHFLFNTLNTVSKTAYLEDANLTSNLIDSIASLLRYSLGDIKRSVYLRDEVAIIYSYIRIQKTRFVERITFETHIDESCLDIPIPRLALQPIIENACLHGVEPKEDGGVILLRIYPTDTKIVVEVIDNGVGMTQHQQNKMLTNSQVNEEHIGHSTGLGLRNVMRRLQLFYQKEHVLEIESTVDVGTTIKLLLPKDYTNNEERLDIDE